MLLSIIIPIYNVEKYVIECLDSVFQSNPFDWFEVICIDDCGNDQSISIVENYIYRKNIRNCTMVTHEHNRGLSAARNTGVSVAKGKYVMFLDSDDFLIPNALESLYKLICNEKYDFVEVNCREKNEGSSEIYVASVQELVELECETGDEYLQRKIDLNQFYPMSVTKIVKKEIFSKCGGFTEGLFFEDEEYAPRMYLSSKKCACYNIPIYLYRRREGSITTTVFQTDAWIKSYYLISESLIKISQSQNALLSSNYIYDHACNLILSLVKNCSYYHINADVREKSFKMIKEKKLWKVVLSSKKMKIKIQSLFLRTPRFFYRLSNIFYYLRSKGVNDEKN